MGDRWYSESLLASHLTVTRSTLENFRKSSLEKNDVKKIGRSLFISDVALEKLLRDLGSDGLDCSACLEKNGAEENTLLELVVSRVFPNPRLIQATNPTTGELVLVQVAKNINFRPHMLVKVHPPEPRPAPQLYRLEGRCPRFPGRW
jgi:hypothetical protein